MRVHIVPITRHPKRINPNNSICKFKPGRRCRGLYCDDKSGQNFIFVFFVLISEIRNRRHTDHLDSITQFFRNRYSQCNLGPGGNNRDTHTSGCGRVNDICTTRYIRPPRRWNLRKFLTRQNNCAGASSICNCRLPCVCNLGPVAWTIYV